MKKLILLCTILLSSTYILSNPIEDREYCQICRACDKIAEQFASMGAMSSPAFHTHLFYALKNVGTPAAYRALKDQIESGRIPKHYLAKW